MAKNQIVALETLSKKIHLQNINLHIVGEGPDQPILNEFVEDKSIQDRVKFYGKLSPAELSVVMTKCEFILSTSLTEGLPKAILEGMSTGLVPIVPMVGELPSICNDGVGFLYPKSTIEDLSEVLTRVISLQPKEYFTLSKNASNAVDKFSWVRFTDIHEKIYEIVKKN